MSISTPPLKTVHRALRSITETLANEAANPTSRAPHWSELDWLLARAVAAMHGVSPLLSSTLHWSDAPAGWTSFLAQQREHTAARFVRIQELLTRLDRCARNDAIALLALKGAELHARGIYSPGERPMADVDLLTRENDTPRTARLLGALGFHETLVNARHRTFEKQDGHPTAELGEHGANDLKIELHSRITEKLPAQVTDISDLVFPGNPSPGLNEYPSTASLMTHLLFHAAGGMATRTLRLLHLHDIARLSAHMSNRDWGELLAAGASRGEKFWWAFAPLQMCARYFPTIPQRVLQTTALWCPRSLARACRRQVLSDVSLSYLWLEAFPGVEWAPSVSAKVRYAVNRIRPPRKLLAERALLLKFEPRVAKSEWARLPQSRRILRWLTTSASRFETLSAVQAALAQSP